MTFLAVRFFSLSRPAVGFFLAVLVLLSPVNSAIPRAQLPQAPSPALTSRVDMLPLPDILRFEHFSIEDGLSQSSVTTIFQDRQGYLWIGTQDGLNRYDGYQFTVFRNDPADENSLSNNSILCIQEDLDGILWFGTWGGGLNAYDSQTGQFTRYQHDPDDPSSISSDAVSSLYVDGVGRLWVGTIGGGLNVLNRYNRKFSHYRANSGSADSISSDYISSIAAAPDGVLWIGTGGFGNQGSGLNRFDLQTGRSLHYSFQPNNPNTLSSNTISSLALDDDGYLWVGTGGYTLSGRGLNRLDPVTGLVTRYQHDSTDQATLGSNDLLSLYFDSTGELWIGTQAGGLDRFDPHSPQTRFIHYRHDPYDLYSLTADTIWPIFQDRTGVLWMGSTFGGLNKINPAVQRFRLYHNNPDDPGSLAGNAVGPMIEDSQGIVMIGTLGYGLDRLDLSNSHFYHISAKANNPLRQKANTFLSLYEDRQRNLWAGTRVGLARVGRYSGQLTYYYHDPQNPKIQTSDLVSAMLEDSSGRMWVGTQDGLDWFNRISDNFIRMRIPEAGPVTDLYLDRLGYLWVGTRGTGLFRLDPATVDGNTVKYTWFSHRPDDSSSLGDNVIEDIYGGFDGTLWLATGRGLDHMSSDGKEFVHYRMEDGLLSNNVLCILEDYQNRLWISSNQGITRFDPVKRQFRSFDAREGLQNSEFSARSCLKTRSGKMFFGGLSGLNSFNAEDIQDNPYPPPVAVTGFRVYNQRVPVDLSGKTPVKLAYQQDFITFEFAALDFHIPQKNQLAYKLDGIDKDWVFVEMGRYASYTNLPGGNYTFRVRGSNNDGVWNEQEAAVPIEVASPLWELAWFQAGGIAVLAIAILLGVRAYLENVRVQNRRLEALVEQRTLSLTSTNERLQQEIEQRQKVEAALSQKAADEAVAAERSRLARELHDAVTQTLFSASLTAEVLPDLWQIDPAEAQRSTEDLRQLTRGALAEMRTLLLELRPSALIKARYEDLLRQLTDAVIGRARLPVELNINGQRSLTPDVQVALYRIAQETLNNIVKYAKASRVCVDLQMSQAGVLLCIQDDGIGFDPTTVRPTSMGMRIMRERAEGIGADLVVISAPGKGTRVEVAWNDSMIKEMS